MGAPDQKAWEAAAGDASAFDALAAQVGLGLTHAVLRPFAQARDPNYLPRLMRSLVETALQAMGAPAGYAFVADYEAMRLAVVVGERVIIGYRRGTSTAAWKLPRWSKDPLKNRPMLEAWAASRSRARDAIAASVRRAAAPVVTAQGDGAALLEAVVADPENLVVRRIYADWLLERGDVRGELIHAQCALDSADLGDDERAAIEQRARDILVAYHRWFEASVKPYVESAETRRGLIEAIAIEGKRFPAHAARLFAEHPIRCVRLFVKDAHDLERIAPLPQLRRVTELDLVARTSPKNPGSTIGLAALAGTDMFASVRDLGFEGVLDKAAAWRKLLLAMRAPALTSLRLASPVPSQVYELLGEATTLPSVHTVSIRSPTHAAGARGDTQRRDAARALAHRTGLIAVELHAWQRQANALAIRELAASTSIVELRLLESTLVPESIAALRSWDRLERLAFPSYLPPLELLAPLLSSPPPRLRELVIGPQPAYVDATPLVDALVAASPQLATVRWPRCHLRSAERARIGATRTLAT